MKHFDLILAGWFPRFAIRRLQAKQVIRNFYEAAQASRLHKKRLNATDPDDVVKPAAETLRDSARSFEQNYDIAKGVLNVLVANIVGEGIDSRPQVKFEDGSLAVDVNKDLMKHRKNWQLDPEVTGDFDEASMQRITCKSWVRDGEVFAQLLVGNIRALKHNTLVPFSIELIESDRIPIDLEDEKKGIVQGIQKNVWGRATNYFVYKVGTNSILADVFRDTKKIPAKRMLHLKIIDRIRQTRGISIFASILNRIDDIKEIDESERVASRVAAAMAGFIQKGSPDIYVAPTGTNTPREMEFQPGMIFDSLRTGETIGTILPNRPNNELIPFRADQLRAVAAGSNTSFSSISKNYLGTYSSQRQELVEQYRIYGILWAYFKERFARKVHNTFIDATLIAGLVELPDNIDMTTIHDAEFSRPPLTWIDPAKEMAGIEKEINLKISSRSDIIRRRGGDPEEVMKQIVEEDKLYKEAGLVSEPPAMNGNGAPEEEDDDDEDVTNQIIGAMEDIKPGEIVRTLDGVYLRRTEDGFEDA
jgi:lambda family phage portal protein